MIGRTCFAMRGGMQPAAFMSTCSWLISICGFAVASSAQVSFGVTEFHLTSRVACAGVWICAIMISGSRWMARPKPSVAPNSHTGFCASFELYYICFCIDFPQPGSVLYLFFKYRLVVPFSIDGALRRSAPHRIALRCVALRCAAPRCIAPRCAALPRTALRCIAFRCVAFHCVAPHCAAPHLQRI